MPATSSRRDTAGIITTFAYDSLNRLTARSASDGSSAAWEYDCSGGCEISGETATNYAIGRPSKTTATFQASTAQTIYRYDALGRSQASQQTVDTNGPYIFHYDYKPAGLTDMRYPSGRHEITTYDISGKPNGVTGYVSGVQYEPHGGIRQMSFGNGVQENWAYNDRLQPTAIQASKSTVLLRIGVGYGAAANNNGNLMSQTIAIEGQTIFTQGYTYDGWNRVKDVTETSSGLPWSQTFGYDPWGNRTMASSLPPALITASSYDGTTNRITGAGWAYGNSGNLTTTPMGSMTYDAEGRMRAFTPLAAGQPAQYLYDAEGRRVKATVSGTPTIFVYYAMGRLAAEYGPAGETGQRYLTTDHLGSTRLVTDANGDLVQRVDYTPFGEELTMQNCGDAVVANRSLRCSIAGYAGTWGSARQLKFTGKERAAETGLDYFGARYFSGAQGRFTSPDPIVVTSERLKNPQELNLYAYVANNPLRYIDPTGAILLATGNQQADYDYLCQIAGDACKDRLKIDEKTGNVTFDIKDLDLSKNEGAKVLNELITSQNTYEFSVGPTIATDRGPVKIDYILANLPAFGDQRQVGRPRAGVADVVGFYFENKKVTRGSNTKLGVAPAFTVVFHELVEAFQKIDSGKGNSYEAVIMPLSIRRRF